MSFCTKHLLTTGRIARNCVYDKKHRRLLHISSTIKTLPTNIATSNSVCGIHTFHALMKKKPIVRAIVYPPKSKGEFVDIWRNITMSELANILQRDLNYVSDLFLGNVIGNHTPISDVNEIHNAIRRAGKRMRIIANPVEVEESEVVKDVVARPPPTKSELKPRPPIVTVMGHVDHGKTTLLDSLRHSRVVDQEFGGITQHIGAFSVKLATGAEVTFLDTPGHAAFSAMRARGANLTDIVVLVVAADDGVMEQTIECINMARSAKVPILVAINKIDSPKADIKNTEQMLLQRAIQVESLGGDVQAIHISALKRINLDQLTEALALQAELLEIGGDPTGPVEAIVVDSRVDVHRGHLCTVVVQRGTLKKGDILVADTAMAKVRLIRDEQDRVLKEVPPGYPAVIEGWRDLPPAGQLVLEVDSEKRAKAVIKIREKKKELEKLGSEESIIRSKAEQHQKVYKEKLELKRSMGRYKLRKQGPRQPESLATDDTTTLHLLLKTDVDGTLEAILETLNTYDYSECQLDILNFGVGSVTEGDVELANTFKGIIYAFNVTCPAIVQQKADAEGVKVQHHNVIYKLVDAIKEDINERLPPKQVEETLGQARVLQQFFINERRKIIPTAGCRCEKGSLKKNALYRISRNDSVIHEGLLSSMRHLKNEVDVIKTDSDCGLQFDDKTVTFEVGDIITCYEHKMEVQTVKWDPGY